MKITIGTTSRALPELMWTDFQILDEAKSEEVARVSVQNTSSVAIYIENWKEATSDGSYMLSPDREVEFNIANLAKLNFIVATWTADVRIITT